MEFWFCVPPVTFSKGFSIEITDASGEKITKTVSSSCSIERNVYKTTAALRISVTDPSAPKGVDLGLSVRWAEFNVGATKAQEFGTVDGRTELEYAAVSYGGNWRMLTDAEWKELTDNCSWIWTALDGVKGYSIKSKIPGFESATIFLPAAGYRYDNTTYAAVSE